MPQDVAQGVAVVYVKVKRTLGKMPYGPRGTDPLEELLRLMPTITLEQVAVLLLLTSPGSYRERPKSEEATRHPPGSAKKVEVLIERFSRKKSLFHPQDL